MKNPRINPEAPVNSEVWFDDSFSLFFKEHSTLRHAHVASCLSVFICDGVLSAEFLVDVGILRVRETSNVESSAF